MLAFKTFRFLARYYSAWAYTPVVHHFQQKATKDDLEHEATTG